MKSLLTALFCLISLSIHAQTFKEAIEKGDAFYSDKKYLESAHAFDKAFEIKEGNASQYYDAACSWALTGDKVQSMAYLNLAADKGWTSLKHMKRDGDLTILHDQKGWEPVLAKVQKNIDLVEKDYNKPLQKQLEAIYVKDQTLRLLHREAEEKFGRGTEEMNYFWEVIGKQDSLNELEVVQIIEKHGWVGRSEVGGRANLALWLVIQHAPLHLQEKYLPLLKASVLKRESRGSHLALLEDRIQMRNGKPQIYGSQYHRDEESGKYVFSKIKNPKKVNERRKEVGLGPIEDYAKKFGIEWPMKE